MTCTVTLSLPSLRLVAADTRLNVTNKDGGEWKIDGMFPNSTLDLNSGASLSIPVKARKIRRIGGCWIASTGDLVTTQLAYSRLESANTFDELLATWAREREEVRHLSHMETGFSTLEIGKTRLLVASPHAQVVTLGFGNAIEDASNFLITWPPGVDAATSASAHTTFENELQAAIDTSDIVAVVRAVVRVILIASEKCSTVGQEVQIGISVGLVGSANNDFYFEGNGHQLLQSEELQGERVA